jgi:competence protein ComEC
LYTIAPPIELGLRVNARRVVVVDWGRVRGRAATWPEWGSANRPGATHWPDLLSDFTRPAAERVREWAKAEVAPGRLMPWLPVAFGSGVAIYFTAEREPAWWAAAVLAFLAVSVAIVSRGRPIMFALALAVAAAAVGFFTGTTKSLLVGHPILLVSSANISISGFVEQQEERDKTDRIVLWVQTIDGDRLDVKPERVRLSVRKGTAPPVGAYVSLTARLNPPLPPLRPGSYDFSRDLYFQGIGAIGFATGAIQIEAAPTPSAISLIYASTIANIRDAVDRRIRASALGDNGSIASALITGKRDAISTPVNDAMYISSLAHVLSISGYHMAVVAGVVFFVVRAALVLIPGFALRHPIKKWAALAALAAITFYLLLSGAEVATQRSFYMTAIVLAGVIVDRATLTFRTLAVSALAVLLLAPEAVVHPSFQMSFAATLALIAGYQNGVPWLPRQTADSSLAARIALWGVREIANLIFASLLAGFATTPYAAFHFHRLAPYGVLANLLAMPIVSAWVMPAGMLALVAMPFGFDAPLWRLMGAGLDWMIIVAEWVANLPGAVGRVPAFGTGVLLVITAGLLIVCLLRTPLRWSGVVLIVLACVFIWRAPKPDVLIAADAEAFAVRGADGHFAVKKITRDPFAVREWLAADADARLPADPKLEEGFACDEVGCVAKLPDGSWVAIARTLEAFGDDCSRAALVIALKMPPPGCAANVVTRKAWVEGGALALYRAASGWQAVAARPHGLDRPWAPATALSGERRGRPSPGGSAASQDATPQPEDLDTDD